MTRILWCVLVVSAACSAKHEPEGDRRQFVIDTVAMPESPDEAAMFALDVDGSGRHLNRLGELFADLVLMEATTNSGIQRGLVSMLLEVRARDLESAGAAQVTLRSGEAPSPPPCNASVECGQHLKGDAGFGIAADSPAEDSGPLATIRDSRLISDLAPLQIAITMDSIVTQIKIPLRVGRIQLTRIDDNRIMSGLIGGAIDSDVLVEQIVPELRVGFNNMLARCSSCNCGLDFTSGLIQFEFDTDDDCVVSPIEMTSHPAIQGLMTPDLMIGGAPAVSFGMAFTAVSASF